MANKKKKKKGVIGKQILAWIMLIAMLLSIITIAISVLAS